MMNRRWMILILIGVMLIPVNLFVPDSSGEVWENDYGYLSVYPDVSKGIVTQEQFCTFIPNVTEEVDISFRFDEGLVSNPDIWIWRNISNIRCSRWCI